MTLTVAGREDLAALLWRGKAAMGAFEHAQMPLETHAAEGEPAWVDGGSRRQSGWQP